MKYFIFLLLFWVTSFSNFAQQKMIDSLHIILKNAKEDTNKVNTLNRLIEELDRSSQYEQAKIQAAYSVELANKLNYKKGKADALNAIGKIYHDQSNYPEAFKNFFLSLKILKEIDDKHGICASYGNIGLTYWNQGNYPEALKYHFEAIKIAEEIGDKLEIASSYGNIGIIYKNQGNYSEALKNHFASLKVFEEIDNEKGIANSYNNIGIVYKNQGNNPEALKNYLASLKIRNQIGDKKGIATSYSNIGIIYANENNYTEALKNFFSSLKIREEIGDKRGIADSYNNIGSVYADQAELFKSDDSIKYRNKLHLDALKNFFSSLKIYEEIGDKQGVALSYVVIGSINMKLDNKNEAKKHLENALTLSTQIGDKEVIRDSYDNLSKLADLQGNWKQAYQHHKLFIIYRDSLDNEESKKEIIQASMNYEFEKREALSKADQEKKDVLVATEMKKHQIIRYAVSGILVLLILFTLFLYNRFRLISTQKNIIELKEKETNLQKEVIEEKHKEITDSINYAERIQRSFLATTQMLDENLKDYFIFFKPKDIVSGDFYWAGKLKNGDFAFSCADSTGHGVPGAIVSILNITSLEKSIELETEPNKILDETRKIIINRLKKDGSTDGGKDGMDCSLLVINKERTQLKFAAANNPVFIVRFVSPFEGAGRSAADVELIEFKADKMPVGKHDKDMESFSLQNFTLQKGDIIYTITDGFADQFGGNNLVGAKIGGKKYMIKNLKEFLLQIAHLSMPEQQQKLATEFSNWKGNNEQVDDVTIVGIRV